MSFKFMNRKIGNDAVDSSEYEVLIYVWVSDNNLHYVIHSLQYDKRV